MASDPVGTFKTTPNLSGTGGTFTLQMPGIDEVGDHSLWVRSDRTPATLSAPQKIASHPSNRVENVRTGDWVVGAYAPEERELNDLLFNFPDEVCIFTGIGDELLWSRLHSAFLWIRSVKVFEGPHEAYTNAQAYVESRTPMLKAVEFRTRGITLNKWTGRYDSEHGQIYDLSDLSSLYAEPVLVRVLTADALRLQAEAPQMLDFVDPTWGGFIADQMQKGDVVFRKVVSALGTGDYKDLFLACEAILSHFDADKKRASAILILKKWASEAELESFRQTAHNYFRHHSPKPQSAPYMAPAMADNLIRRIFSYFIVFRMAKTRRK